MKGVIGLLAELAAEGLVVALFHLFEGSKKIQMEVFECFACFP